MTTARERLEGGYYNSDPVSPENPGGLSDGGHVGNFPAALADVAAAGAEIIASAGAAVEEAGAPLVAAAEAAATTSGEHAATATSKAEEVADIVEALEGQVVIDPDQLVPDAVTDSNGWPLSYVEDDAGTLRSTFMDALVEEVDTALEKSETIVVDPEQLVDDGITDPNGNALLAFDPDGTPLGPGFARMIAATAQAQATADKASGAYYRDLRMTSAIVHVTINGQSNSIAVGGLRISMTPRNDALMFATGVAQEHAGSVDPAVLYAAFAPLQAGQYPGTAYDYEDPALGMAQMYAQLMQSRHGIDTATLGQKMLFTQPGREGQQVSAFNRTGPLFQRMIAGWTYGRALALASGKSHSIGPLVDIQGEADDGVGTSMATFMAKKRQYRRDAELEARALMGKPDFRLPMIQTQVNTWRISAALTGLANPYPNVALAQLAMAEDDMIALACPTYIFDMVGLHYDAVSHAWGAAYVALAWDRWTNDGLKPQHLRPVSAERQGRVVLLTYDPPSGRLAWGDDWVNDPGNKGYSVQTLDHATTLAISGAPELVGRCQVQFVLAADPGGPVEVQYAFSGGNVHGGRLTGPRGCLRDTSGNALNFIAGDGTSRAMHHWAPLHRLITN